VTSEQGAASASPEPESDTPSFRERTRLNFQDSYYRGTLLGAAHLASLAHLAATPDDPGISPETKRVNDSLRQEYRQILADLARYDRMRSSANAGDFGATALGQLGGSVLSPESWIGLGAKGANSLSRIVKAGLQQGAVNAVTDPAVQGLNIGAGAQDAYDPARARDAAIFGALFGSGSKLGTEAIGHIGTRWWLSPAEEFEWKRHNQGTRVLRDLDPINPELSTTAIAPWMPTRTDNIRAQDQIKALRPTGSSLEDHHNFPTAKAFEKNFRDVGIDPEQYRMYVDEYEHRRKPDGMHTGKDNWNAVFKRYILDNPTATREDFLALLSSMMKNVKWLKI